MSDKFATRRPFRALRRCSNCRSYFWSAIVEDVEGSESFEEEESKNLCRDCISSNLHPLGKVLHEKSAEEIALIRELKIERNEIRRREREKSKKPPPKREGYIG